MSTTHLAPALVSLLLFASLPAHAIPAFARKYGTSCTTCHTAYPKLTPFGEAFRRNGFRFPGVDSDYAKQDTVTIKAQTPGSEPAWVAAIPPLSASANGQALIYPVKGSTASAANNNALVDLGGLVSEAHIFTGGTITDTISYFSEVTITPGGAQLELAQVYFNDLLGPAHALNLRVGRGFSNLTSFGPHSSFLADALLPPTYVTQLNGATGGSWTPGDQFDGLELSGTLGGRFIYNLGWNAGEGADLRSAEDVYGHVGYKWGGMRADGEGKSDANAERPWEETSLTLDLFGYHDYGSVQYPDALVLDTVNTVGAGLRAQWGSLELNAGFLRERHSHAEAGGSGASYFSQYDELSYIVFPWLIPAVRFEYGSLNPDAGCTFTNGSGVTGNCSSASDWRLWPGVAIVPYPNLKLVLTALFEGSSNAPLSGNWSAVGGFGPPASGSGTEFQYIQIFTQVSY